MSRYPSRSDCSSSALSPTQLNSLSHLLVRPERIATLLLTTWLATWLSPLLADDSLPSWRHTATRQRILAFIREVTTPGSPSFVAPPARIAVFDNDGTLWTEQPVYVQLRYSMHRATHLVKTHPTWQDKEPFRSALTGGFKAMLSDGQLFTRLTEVTLGNITVSALHKDVLRWLSTSRHARFDRLYTALTYQPMLELLALLRLHGFKNYIVSGGDTEFLRAWAPAARRGTRRRPRRTTRAAAGRPRSTRGSRRAAPRRAAPPR